MRSSMAQRRHAMLEYTARPGTLDELREAAREFVDTSLERESGLSRHEAHVVGTSRQVVHVMTFEDGLAARDHREAKHTRSFTEHLEELAEDDLAVHELDPVKDR
jgi:quinol monooxygenase YgiN